MNVGQSIQPAMEEAATRQKTRKKRLQLSLAKFLIHFAFFLVKKLNLAVVKLFQRKKKTDRLCN